MTSCIWMPDSSLHIIGIDEAGRGCWAGPVVAGAAYFRPDVDMQSIGKLNDSKNLNTKQRKELIEPIKKACFWGVGEASAEEIDQVNILQATFLAMKRALDALFLQAQLEDFHFLKAGDIQVDGSMIPPIAPLGWSIQAVVKGDGKVAPIAAASILAKEHRDDLLIELEGVYPGYGFAKHKSYGTPEHMAALEKLGPCSIHRKTFKPIAKLLNK